MALRIRPEGRAIIPAGTSAPSATSLAFLAEPSECRFAESGSAREPGRRDMYRQKSM